MNSSKNLIGPISIISIAYLSSRLLGFFREILLAKWTGVSSAADTLDLAFIVPDFLFYLSAGGYLAITLIPILSDRSKRNKDSLNDYFLSLFYGLSLIFISISLIFFLLRSSLGNLLEVKDLDLFLRLFGPIVFSQAFFINKIIYSSCQCSPKSNQMTAPIFLRNVICETLNVFLIRIIPLQCDFNRNSIRLFFDESESLI